jgi:uncharacterized membrane protein
MVREYEDIHPGLANRIFSAFEKQLDHRQRLERSVVNSNRLSQVLGQVFGFLLALAVIGVAAYLLANGKSLVGLGALLLDFGGFLWIYMYGKKTQERERAQKRAELEG